VSEVPRGLNGKGLVRHYDALDAEERFRLAIEARARDDVELDRLASSVPMVAYKISDPEYTDRVHASREVAAAVALDLRPLAAELRMLRATRALAGTVAAAVAHEVHEETPEVPLEEASSAALAAAERSFAEAEGQVRSRAAAVFEAFRRVCREMRLEPEVVLRAHLGPLVDEFGLDELAGVKPDKKTLAGWSEVFTRAWRERGGR
jgi:hypothetical protein